MSNKYIPFMDLNQTNSQIKNEIISDFSKMIDESNFISGPEIEMFESEFSKYTGVRHTVACSNGTDAITLSLRALSIGTGDVVVTVPNTFIATVEAINAVGAEVVFVDVDEEQQTMDPEKLESFLSNKAKDMSVKAVIPVHLFGQMANMSKLRQIADKYNIYLIEDSAQAHGAKHNGYGPGYYGDLSTFSFYPGKNLGAFGDAGAICTNSDKLAKKIKMLSNHGRTKKYEHQILGYNNRMDTLQAVILRHKLPLLDLKNEMRRKVALEYTKHLKHIQGIRLPKLGDGNEHVYHLFVIRTSNRDYLISELKKRGVITGIHYPVPLHLQKALSMKNYNLGDFPITEILAKEIVSLPLWPEMTTEQVKFVCENIEIIQKGIYG